jgi:hypothetical protein
LARWWLWCSKLNRSQFPRIGISGIPILTHLQGIRVLPRKSRQPGHLATCFFEQAGGD